MISKRIKQFTFRCGSTSCPKMLDDYNHYKYQRLRPPLKSSLKRKGCEQIGTSIWYLSNTTLSDDEVNSLPTIGVILSAPDPTGAQGVSGGYGVGKDIVFEQLFKAHKQKPIKVALFYITRGYSFSKVLRNELVSAKISPQAIAYCMPYLQRDLKLVNLDKILLCGQEALNTFVPSAQGVATFRRLTEQTITVDGTTYEVQGTFDPYLAAIAPVYIKSIQDDCKKLFEKAPPPFETNYKLITEIDEALDYLTYLEDFTGLIAFDVETESLNRKALNKLATLQFATNDKKSVVIPYQHSETPFSPDELAVLAKRLTRLFKEPIKAKGWVCHNAKFENMIMDMHFGTMLESAPIYDTQAMAFLLDETRSERKADVPEGGGIYTLKQLAWDLMGFTGYDKGILKIRKEGSLIDLPLKDLAAYGAMDAVVTFRLWHRIVELAKEDHNYDQSLLKLTKLFYGPITRLIAHIERTGFKTDLKTLRKLSAKFGPFEEILKNCEDQLKATEAFHEANKKLVASRGGGQVKGVMGDVPWVLDFSKPDHQALVFFKTMELEPVSFSEKTGRPAIDDDFFEAYCSNPEKGIEGYLEADLFYKYQEAKKMRDTFITKMMERVDPASGDSDCKIDQRIRSDIHYSRLVTGRFAMTRPNLQQVPKATEGLGENEFSVRKAVKDVFTVDRNCALLQVDYKVNEVRWAAILAKDTEMARIFTEAAKRTYEACLLEDEQKIKEAEFAEDIHRNTAAAAFGPTIERVTKAQRNSSKAIVFGILFQQSIRALAETIKVSEEEALEFQKKFFSKMVGIEELIKNLKEHAAKFGFVETPHGRRRRFWSFQLPLSHPNREGQIARNLRQSVNAPVQGAASDASMGGGAVSLLEYIQKNNKPWLIQNVVHDSCLVQVPMEHTAEALSIMQSLFVDEAMNKMREMGIEFNLPLGIDCEVGIFWGSLEKWNGTKTHANILQEKILNYWGSM